MYIINVYKPDVSEVTAAPVISAMSLIFYQSTRRYNPQESHLHIFKIVLRLPFGVSRFVMAKLPVAKQSYEGNRRRSAIILKLEANGVFQKQITLLEGRTPTP